MNVKIKSYKILYGKFLNENVLMFRFKNKLEATQEKVIELEIRLVEDSWVDL